MVTHSGSKECHPYFDPSRCLESISMAYFTTDEQMSMLLDACRDRGKTGELTSSHLIFTGHSSAHSCRGLLVIGGFGHLKRLFPQGACLGRLPGAVECRGELKSGSVVLWIPLQHFSELDGGRVRIIIGVQKIEARLHDSFLDRLLARDTLFAEPSASPLR